MRYDNFTAARRISAMSCRRTPPRCSRPAGFFRAEMRALYIVISLSMFIGCSGSKDKAGSIGGIIDDTANQIPNYIEETVSDHELWEEAVSFIAERKYPQAISVLSKIEGDDRADDLLQQLRYVISGDYIQNLGAGVAAIDNEGKIVIRMDDELYKEYGYADAEIGEWANIKRISCDTDSYAPGLDALSRAGAFFSVPANEEIRQRNEQLGMVPSINILETSNSTFAATDQSGKLHLYNKYDGCLKSEPVQKEIEGWSDIVDIVTGGTRLAVLHKDGTVSYVYPNKPDIYIDMNEWTDIVDISGAAGGSIAALKADGTVLISHWMLPRQIGENYRPVSGWSDIIAISKTSQNILGLKRDGTVVTAGLINEGQKGVSEWTDIVAVSAGPDFHVGLKSDGTLVIAGESGEHWSLPDVSNVTDLYVPKINYQISDYWEEAASFIAERKYPQAISVLSKIEGDDRAHDLLRQLRSFISGDSIQNLGAGVAAIDNEGKVVIRMDDELYKELGYADAGIEDWTDIKRISCDTTAAYPGLDAISNAGAFFSVLDEEEIRLRNRQLGMIPGISMDVRQDKEQRGMLSGIDLLETGNSAFAVTDQSGKLYYYSRYGSYLERESVQKEIESWSDIVDIVSGRYSLAVLHKNGTVSYVYSEKQESVNYVVYPIRPDIYKDLNEWTDIVDISGAAIGSIAALKADGTVLVSNWTEEPRAEEEHYESVAGWSDIIAISKTYQSILGLKRDGTVVTAGAVNEGQKKVSEWTDIVAVSAGPDFHVGLKSDGTLVIAGESGRNWSLPDVSDVKDLYVPKISYVQPESGD